MIEEGLLHRRQRHDPAVVAALSDALDGPDPLAVEEIRAGDAGPHFLAGMIVLVPDHHAGMADPLAAAEARSRQVEHLVQHVDHHHSLRHIDRAVSPAVDHERQWAHSTHARTSRIFSGVTGSSLKRWPIACATPFTIAATIG